MVFWTCPACDYEAEDEEEKRRHIEEHADDPDHKDWAEKLKEEAKDRWEDVKDKAEDVVDKAEDAKDKSQE